MALTLIGKKREPASKGRLGKLRREKLVPGMVYGRGRENTPISLDGHELSRIFNHIGSRAVFSLQIEGEKSPVMVLVKELQKNPLSQELTHVDFMQIQMNEPIHSLVSVHWSGEEELVKKGAVLQIMSREIPVACLPADLPETIVYDISALEAGDRVTAGEIPLPQKVELLEDPETVMANIVVPTRGPASPGEIIEVEEEPPALES